MRKLLLAIVLVINVYALDELSSISSDNQSLLNSVLEKLDLQSTSNSNKVKIYNKFKFALEKDWYATWWHNSTAKNTKIENANTKFIELTLVDESRVYSFTFIHFKQQKQMTVLVRQYISTDSSSLLDKFKELKNDTNYKLLAEKNSYGYLNQDGYMSDTIINVKDGYGMISYIDMTTLDL